METELPLSRVRTIMKSSTKTGQITNEVVFLMTKSTEMFIKHITKEAFNAANKTNKILLKYEHLADYVHDKDNMEFLLQVLPKKITVRNFKALLEESNDDSDKTTSTDEEN